jgi:hypothetical protein
MSNCSAIVNVNLGEISIDVVTTKKTDYLVLNFYSEEVE